MLGKSVRRTFVKTVGIHALCVRLIIPIRKCILKKIHGLFPGTKVFYETYRILHLSFGFPWNDTAHEQTGNAEKLENERLEIKLYKMKAQRFYDEQWK